MTELPALGANPGQPADLLIIGGGINGAGIARDAAGRGLRVILCEQNDLASGTSSMSSKLIHGGLRYLEYGEFRLVREALAEREVMLRIAGHMCWPVPIVLPQVPGLRPGWLIRLGLFLYDHIGGRKRVPASHGIDLWRDPIGLSLEAGYRHGFRFYDCWIDDARLVVLNAVDAAARGADIRTRTRCVSARREQGLWRATVRDAAGDSGVWARVVVNAAGPWAGQVGRDVLALPNPPQLSLVKGSHIVVPRLQPGQDALMLQNPDRRIVFVLPYEDDYTLIGTTEEVHHGDPADASISADELDYLLATTARFLRRKPRLEDVRWSFAGVRPLIESGMGGPTSASRDYSLSLDTPADGAPLLQVLGGKLTTYRRLAEEALERLQPVFPALGKSWTATTALPGSDTDDLEAWHRAFLGAHPGLPNSLLRRLARTYGTRSSAILGKARDPGDLGASFGSGLSEAELTYIRDHEWARTAADALWRRTKMGLRLTADEAARVERWFGR